MADPQDTSADAGAKQAPAQQSESSEARDTVSGWKERARRAFQVSPHAIEGALHDVAADRLLAESEVRTRLDAFGKREG